MRHLVYSLTTKFKMKRDADILKTRLRVVAVKVVSMTNVPSSKSNVSLCSLLVESNVDECKSNKLTHSVRSAKTVRKQSSVTLSET